MSLSAQMRAPQCINQVYVFVFFVPCPWWGPFTAGRSHSLSYSSCTWRPYPGNPSAGRRHWRRACTRRERPFRPCKRSRAVLFRLSSVMRRFLLISLPPPLASLKEESGRSGEYACVTHLGFCGGSALGLEVCGEVVGRGGGGCCLFLRLARIWFSPRRMEWWWSLTG